MRSCGKTQIDKLGFERTHLKWKYLGKKNEGIK
jgi:hypothetical protein